MGPVSTKTSEYNRKLVREAMAEHVKNNQNRSLNTIMEYVQALSDGNHQKMNELRAPTFVLDFVHGDAFRNQPLNHEQTQSFWPAWFKAFSEIDYEVTRTIAAEKVVVTQWIFTGVQNSALGPPIFDPPLKPSGRTICLRGVSIYDVQNGRIERETAYIDLATLMVELGVEI